MTRHTHIVVLLVVSSVLLTGGVAGLHSPVRDSLDDDRGPPEGPGSVSEPVTRIDIELSEQSEMPSTAEGYLAAFKSLNNTEAFSRYSEFEVLRSQAIFDVQVGEFTESKERRMSRVLKLLRTFRDGYRLQQNGSYLEAIKVANESRAITASLRDVERGQSYAALSEIALDRFYERTGQALQTLAEDQSTTPERLALLRRAAIAYKQAGSVDRYSRILVRVDSVEKEFRADLEEMNESIATAERFLSNCRDCGSLGATLTTYNIGTFPRYQQALNAEREVQQAIALAEEHGLTSRMNAIESLQSEIASRQSTLMEASVGLLVGYAVVLGLFAAVVSWRLWLWHRDLVAKNRGDAILVGEMLRA